MIIKNLILKNFFRIYGEVKIECSTDLDKNVTVIKGDNGTGKTTMLSAFHWAFYGEVIEPLTINEMLNKKARAEMKVGETIEASVQVEFSDKDIDYIFLRKQAFIKNSTEDIVKKGDADVIITNLSQTNSRINNRDFFNNIIPKNLSGFFFFDGERIDRLAKIDGRKEIKQAILDLLGLTSIKNIESYLAPIKQDFNREYSKLSTSVETTQLTRQYDEVLSKIRDNEEKIDMIKNRIAENQKVKDECDNYLKTHNVDYIRQKEAERKKLESEKISINNQIKDKETDILKHISTNFKYYLIAKSFPQIREFLEDKRKKKVLPSDIKETFIQDLLDSKICICGRPIIQGNPEYNTLLKLKETAGKQELDESYTRLTSFMNSSHCRDMQNNFFNIINQYKQFVNSADDRKTEIKKELDSISKDLLSFDDELITAKENARENAKELIEDFKYKLRQGQEAIEILKKKEQELNSQISKAEDKDKGANMYKKASALTYELEKLNTRIHEFFIDITQEDMDSYLKDVFSILARKQEREPSLSKNFELQIINKETKQAQILSTGERQITSLAFIGAIVSYAKNKIKNRFMSDFAGGDYPIVMDSPFGYLDPTHKENVAKGIPSLASQVIVIVSEGQWDGIVKESIQNKVGAIYEMKDGYANTADSEFTEVGRVL